MVSAAWHLMWMGLVSIVVFPTAMAKPTYPEVSFVGPILEEPKLEVAVTEARVTLLGARKRSFDFGPSPLDEPAASPGVVGVDEEDPFKWARARQPLRQFIGGTKSWMRGE